MAGLAGTAGAISPTSDFTRAADPPMRARLQIFRPQVLDRFKDKKHGGITLAPYDDLASDPGSARRSTCAASRNDAKAITTSTPGGDPR